jgi:hypothetical protein
MAKLSLCIKPISEEKPQTSTSSLGILQAWVNMQVKHCIMKTETKAVIFKTICNGIQMD